MHTFVAPLFGKAKVKLSQTSRAVTPFGGLASFIAFLDQIGYTRQIQGIRLRSHATNLVP